MKDYIEEREIWKAARRSLTVFPATDKELDGLAEEIFCAVEDGDMSRARELLMMFKDGSYFQ
jgi:hypothetical protein